MSTEISNYFASLPNDPFGVKTWLVGAWDGRNGNLDPPLWVVTILNRCGLHWPIFNEDQLWAFAKLVRQFATAVQTTHDDATQHAKGIAQALSAPTMQSGWANITNTQVNELVALCNTLADGLDIAGDKVRIQKAMAIVSLIGTVIKISGELIAAPETFGASALLIIEDTFFVDNVINGLLDYIEFEVVGMILQQLLEPLVQWVNSMAAGLDWSKSGATVGAPNKVNVNYAQLSAEVNAMHGSATTLRSKLNPLVTSMKNLKF